MIISANDVNCPILLARDDISSLEETLFILFFIFIGKFILEIIYFIH